MAIEGRNNGERRGAQSVSMEQLIDSLGRFDGPMEEFLARLLAIQCQLASASSAAILRPGEGDQAQIVAIHPAVKPDETTPAWLSEAAGSIREVQAAGATVIKALYTSDAMYGQPASRHIVSLPLRGDQGIRGVAVYLIESSDQAVVVRGRERLELTAGLLSLYEMRLTLRRRQADTQRLKISMEVLAAINEHDRFTSAAMAFCNELAARWQCDRASVGFLKGRYIYLKALSNTEKFSRKMKLAQDIEAAMEECFDQNVEIVYPASPENAVVTRSSAELSRRHGPTAVLSLPLREKGDPMGVVTVERAVDQPFALAEIESLRLTCDLCTAWLSNLYRSNRWFGAKAAASVRKGLALLVGAKHTWTKIATLGACAAMVFMIFGQGDYNAEGSLVLEAVRRRVVPAPFDGFIKSVFVKPDDTVVEGETVMAELDTTDLRLQLASARAEQVSYAKQATAAMEAKKTAEAQIFRADADGLAAQIKLLEYRIKNGTLVSPVTGQVLTGDLESRIGAPVKKGDVMFEVALLSALRGEVLVPEEEIADVILAHKEARELSGELATIGQAGRHIAFV
ncbi:MAG: efflux RND transporter periplasmic adaptor subunit, partial [Planctomycetes bacterium]|nr:efflux RND transporter periplasmic adaptor subunit [Planctomycetota bacterium]